MHFNTTLPSSHSSKWPALQTFFRKQIGEALTILGRKDGLITNGFLCECHHIVYVLGGSYPGFLALVIEPEVRPATEPSHCPALATCLDFSHKTR